MYSSCKPCHLRTLKIQRSTTISPKHIKNITPEIVASYVYQNIKRRTGITSKLKTYKDINCEVSQQDLIDFYTDNWDTYMELHKKWKESDFNRRLSPSIDRIDPKKHYSLDNIQIVPFYVNASRANKGRVQSEEHKKNLSLAHVGYKLSEEQKKKMSETKKRMYAEGWSPRDKKLITK